jgi:hypothetical protein
MASDIMIDLETLDVTPYCVILSIGAVRFNPYGKGVVEKLELRPTIEDQTEKYNRVINESTLAWWSKQSAEAMEDSLSDYGRIPFKDCMEKLYKFCWNRRAIWSNGAAFDIVACETGMTQTLTDYSNPIPWPFWTVRDTRTLYEIAGVRLKDTKYGSKTTHKAVEDAAHQAIVVQDAYHNLTKAGLLRENR